LTLIWVELQRK